MGVVPAMLAAGVWAGTRAVGVVEATGPIVSIGAGAWTAAGSIAVVAIVEAVGEAAAELFDAAFHFLAELGAARAIGAGEVVTVGVPLAVRAGAGAGVIVVVIGAGVAAFRGGVIGASGVALALGARALAIGPDIGLAGAVGAIGRRRRAGLSECCRGARRQGYRDHAEAEELSHSSIPFEEYSFVMRGERRGRGGIAGGGTGHQASGTGRRGTGHQAPGTGHRAGAGRFGVC
jgi:hypothetical protein